MHICALCSYLEKMEMKMKDGEKATQRSGIRRFNEKNEHKVGR